MKLVIHRQSLFPASTTKAIYTYTEIQPCRYMTHHQSPRMRSPHGKALWTPKAYACHSWWRKGIFSISLLTYPYIFTTFVFGDKVQSFLQKLLHIASGNDPVNFFLVIISLYVLSVIGSCFDFVNLLFIGLVSMETLPYLYTRYEDEVDYHAGQMTRKGSKVYKRFLNKIPRGTVKEKKHS
ncbi:hypothetical protein CXB51_022093 [Gossypium anomalum]|uniref:Reticulon-like protein n=1 Tax=Gossypium anomalum TaxID=47600 RepID=A0A8J6CQ08_9ROSI|nr:hypothetical protein CXB51_022093 [Gossypium anomalum]